MNKGVFYGWWIVVALFVVGMLGPMGRYSLTALSPFLQNELLWTKSQIAMAFSIHLWAYAFLALVVGWAIDHFGSRRTVFLGGFFLLVALTLLSQLNNLWQLYVFFGLITAVGVSMTHFVPTQATVRKWFTRKAGLAGGIVTAAFGVGLAILSPLLTWMAGAIGWRATWLICALAFSSVIMILASFVVRNTPESIGLHPDGNGIALQKNDMNSLLPEEVAWLPKEALRTSSFWLLFFASCIHLIPVQGMLTQVVVWGVDLGEPPATAGIFMTAFTLPSVAGKVAGGWLGDRWGRKRVIGMAYLAALLVMLSGWLTVSSKSSLLMIAILFGIAYGLPVALFPAYLGDLFGRASLGTLLGLQVLGSCLFGGFGPLIWGSISDITGGYNLACLISALMYAVAIVLLIFIKPRKLNFTN